MFPSLSDDLKQVFSSSEPTFKPFDEISTSASRGWALVKWEKLAVDAGSYARSSVFPTEGFFASPNASSLIWTQVERFGRFFQVQFSTRLLRVEPPKSKSKYRASTEEWTVNSLFPACLGSTQMCFQPFVLWQVQQLFCPSRNASPEQGIFNPEQDFDKAAEQTFGRNPQPADDHLHRRPPSSQMDYRRALQLWRSQRTRRISWAGLRRSGKIFPCDCRSMSRFTATLTC